MKPDDPKVLYAGGALGFVGLLLLWGRFFPSRTVTPPSTKPAGFDPLSIPASEGPAKLTRHLSDTFFRSVLRLAADWQALGAGVVAEDFLGVLNAESGINPSARNGGSGCAGMNQICNLRGVGWNDSPEAYLALSPEAQFPYVRRFLDGAVGKRHRAVKDMGRLYLLNFNPGNLERPDSFHLYDEATGGDAYRLNQATLDPEHKGYIEVADADRYVKRALASNGPFGTKATPKFAYWAELRGRLNKVRAEGIA